MIKPLPKQRPPPEPTGTEILPAERPADDPCSDQDDFLGGGQDEAGASPLLPSKEPAVAA